MCPSGHQGSGPWEYVGLVWDGHLEKPGGRVCPLTPSQLKTQMWQLLKGHDHLQDEFSVFFDHLRPAASRLGDFEEINWTEEKEYEVRGQGLRGFGKRDGRGSVGSLPRGCAEQHPLVPQFDGFEEVALPDVEEEEEPPKMPTASKSKRRKEIGVQNHDKVSGLLGVICQS